MLSRMLSTRVAKWWHGHNLPVKQPRSSIIAPITVCPADRVTMPMLLLHLPSRASINRHIGSSALPTGALLQVFKVQPLYARDVWDTGPTLTTNLQDVQQTCQQASDGLKQDAKNGRLLTGLSGMQR